jgi:pyrroline-5-carboxylate reductase
MDGSLGFVGAGMMAEAIMKGVLSAGAITAERITASDVYRPRLEFIRDSIKCQVTDSASEASAKSDTVVIAVKPQVIESVLASIKHGIRPNQLVVSIAAGVTIAQLAAGLPAGTRIIRVMPNTPCLVGETAAAYATGDHATEADAQAVEQLMTAAGGSIYRLQEYLLDAVTGLSGSGPAFVYIMIEALADGGVRAGLPRNIALGLAAQTVYGSSKMVIETGQHPGQLKDAVCSPGGTTIAGVHALERNGVRGALIEAVLQAAERSKELSKL